MRLPDDWPWCSGIPDDAEQYHLFLKAPRALESDDLHRWRRVRDPHVVNVDPRWYKTLDVDPEASETWRDPFVFRDPSSDGWHMLITARAVGVARDHDGVLAHARSAEMRAWELGPPVRDPGAGFGQLEWPRSA